MKKVISLLLVVLLLTLSGCEKNDEVDGFTTGIEDEIEYNCWRELKIADYKYFCTVNDKNGEQTLSVTHENYEYLQTVALGLTVIESYYTKEEVDEMFKNYISIEELNDMFTDYGLDIDSPEDLVNLIDDLEDRVEALENVE